jgi:hypothetical protein
MVVDEIVDDTDADDPVRAEGVVLDGNASSIAVWGA